MWAPCRGCFVPRWVGLTDGQPQAPYCPHCKMTTEVRRHLGRVKTKYYLDNPEMARQAFERMSTPEAVEKRAAKHRGKKMSEQTRWKLSMANKGERAHMYGKKHTPETLAKMRTPRSSEAKANIRAAALAKPPMSEEAKQKIRNTLARPEVIAKMREKALARTWGADNPHWLGGISFEPYSPEFNGRLKETVRQRDGYSCQVCGFPENGRALDVHHIDYDKKNSALGNLITVCVPCHAKTSHHRSQWQSRLSKLMEVKGYV